MEGEDEAVALAFSSLPQGWSQLPLPLEILGIIFSHLPRKCDLLNTRLVCRSWNEECVRVMRKPESEFLQTLTEINIQEYLNFISDGHNLPQLILPFHLSVTISPRIPDSDADPACEGLYITNLKNLIENIESIRAIFGEECIQKLTLKTVPEDLSSDEDDMTFGLYTEFLNGSVIEFLKKVSRGLKILDVSDFAWQIGRYTDDEVKSNKLCDLNFPKLKTLICYKCKRVVRPNVNVANAIHPIYEYIIKYSPNLENLEGIEYRDLVELPIHFNRLKSLLINKIKTYPSEILKIFRDSTDSLVLQELQFSIAHWILTDKHYSDQHWAQNIGVLHNILECLSTTLKSLTITACYNGIMLARLMKFPRLPTLKYLRLDILGSEDFLFLGREEIKFNPETFPMLQSAELPLGLIFGDFEFGSFGAEEMEVPVKFTSVNELTILLSHIYWMSGVGSYKGVCALKHLLKVFPNITKLSIKNEYLEQNDQQGVKHLLQSLIQNPLSKNIQEISIEGFEEDFLGQVLGQMDSLSGSQGQGGGAVDFQVEHTRAGSNNSYFLTNVRTVKLELSPVTHTECSSDDPFPHSYLSMPNLTAIAKYFPSLQIIEISELLFRGTTEAERKELIQTLTTIFPYLRVHVLN